MAQVCSVMGEGLGLLPNRALSASVRRPSANDIFLPPRHRVYREYSARMIGHPLRVQPPSSGTSMSSPSLCDGRRSPDRALSASVRRPSANDIFLPPTPQGLPGILGSHDGLSLRYSPPRPGPRCPALRSLMGEGLLTEPSPPRSGDLRRTIAGGPNRPVPKANHAADVQSWMHRRFAVKDIA